MKTNDGFLGGLTDMLSPIILIKEDVGAHGVTFSVWRSLSGKLAPGFCRLSTLNGEM
jgi:hypothetical protein